MKTVVVLPGAEAARKASELKRKAELQRQTTGRQINIVRRLISEWGVT